MKHLKLLILSLFVFVSVGHAANTALQIDFILAGVRHPTTDEALDGGKVKTYLDGTSTLSALWTDKDKSAAAANPVILDSAGKAEVYGDNVYKMEIYDSDDVLLETINGLEYRTKADTNLDSISNYDDIADAVSSIGATPTTLLIDTATTSDENTSVPTTLHFQHVQGGIITVASATTLTIADPEQTEAGAIKIYTLTGTGKVAYTNGGEIWADWWGKENVDTAVDNAVSSISEYDIAIIRLSGGTWDFATGGVDMGSINKTITFQGAGVGSKSGGSFGTTKVICSGTEGAFTLTGGQTLRDMMIISSGSYALELGDQTTGGGFWGLVQNVYCAGGSASAVIANQIAGGTCINMYAEYSSGAGMIVGRVGASSNTQGYFVSCRFNNNANEGVLYASTGGGNFSYTNCIFEDNEYEALKATAAITGTVLDHCHIEANQNDAGRTDGYFSVFISSNSNANNSIYDCTFLSVDQAWNGTTGNKHVGYGGTLYIKNNRWTGVTLGGEVEPESAAAVLYYSDPVIDVSLIGGVGASNKFFNLGGAYQQMDYTSNTSLVDYGPNVIHTNKGATGQVTLTLPSVSKGRRFNFATYAPYQFIIDPEANDMIVPLTNAVGTSVSNIGSTGSTLVLTGIDDTYWGMASRVGEWIDDTDAIYNLANDATPSVKGRSGLWNIGGTTTITDFDDGSPGQVLYIVAAYAVTITDNASIQLSGGANFDMATDETLNLVCKTNRTWLEIGRGENN